MRLHRGIHFVARRIHESYERLPVLVVDRLVVHRNQQVGQSLATQLQSATNR